MNATMAIMARELVARRDLLVVAFAAAVIASAMPLMPGLQGYTAEELEEMASSVGLVPEGRGAYSRFFTESIELVINFGYVRVLSRKTDSERQEGEIAPSTSGELQRMGTAFFPIQLTFMAAVAIYYPDGPGFFQNL